jgi:hypothetical protein
MSVRHAYEVYPHEIYILEMHVCETPAQEIHTRDMHTGEIYSQRSMTFLESISHTTLSGDLRHSRS